MDFVVPLIEEVFRKGNPIGFAESFLIYMIVWWKLKPHLKLMEGQMTGVARGLEALNETVREGFAAGEARFQKLEGNVTDLQGRVSAVENQTKQEE
jgi:hypothetical protein